MDEKFYDLLEKLYTELINTKTELRAEIQGIRTDLEEVKSTMATKEDLGLAVAELKAETQMVYNEAKDLRKDLKYVEIITAKNAYDIALLREVE